MAIVLSTVPDWLWVKNPCNIELTGGTGELQYAKILLYENDIYISEGFYIARADYIKADISGFAKAIFDLIPDDDMGVSLYGQSETYKIITIWVFLNDDEYQIYKADHVFIYGGKDVRDPFTIDDFVMVAGGTTYPDFLTEFVKPTTWAGLPFDVRFTALAGEAIEFAAYCYDASETLTLITLDIPGQDSNCILKVNPFELDTPIPADTKRLIFGYSGVNGEYAQEVNYSDSVCSDSVLLRWVNRVGGVDMWNFRRRDTKVPIKTTTVPLPESIEYADNWNRGIAKVVDKETQTNITIGAELVRIEDYAVIAKIAKSDRVDMYMGSGKWMQVIVVDSDFNISHDNDFQDIEMTIVTI